MGAHDALPLAPPATKILVAPVALAMCDALGGPVEFQRRGSFKCVSTYLHNPNFDLAPGTWTDDTSMTLCLAQSLIHLRGGVDEVDQARWYVAWYTGGHLSATGSCFDIGSATREALDIWRRPPPTLVGGALAAVATKLGGGDRCGNGSLMRVLPVGLAFWRTPHTAMDHARRSSAVTHPHPRCQEACAVYTLLVATILSKAALGVYYCKEDLLAVLTTFPYQDPELRATFADGGTHPGGFTAKEPRQISSSGYVVHTLEAALWAFFTTDSFEAGAIKVVNLGDDADTVGAVYGGLAGVWYADAVSETAGGGGGGGGSTFWSPMVRYFRDGLVKRELVEKIARDLAMLSLSLN